MVYGRFPRDGKLELPTAYLTKKVVSVAAGKDAGETKAARAKARREAWEGTLWAVPNTKEFVFIH